MKLISLRQFSLAAVSAALSFSFSVSAKSEWKPKYQTKKTSAQTGGKDIVSSKRAAAIKPVKSEKVMSENELEALYKRKYSSKVGLTMLKDRTFEMKQKAVPTLIKVMKRSDYPDRNRWVATFMLGRIMGKKSGPFISKFANHPNWMMRLASLKTLLALGQDQFKGIYARSLKDEAMVVRMQALDNIKVMKIKSLAPYVWAMLYDKSNYAGMKGDRKRAHIIKQAITVVGDLEFEKAKRPMLTMIQNDKYKDVFNELDYSLNKLTNKSSPAGGKSVKKHYWSRLALKSKTL